MDHDDNEIQVPGTSSPVKYNYRLDSSSPLKPEVENQKFKAQVLRDKFSFVPNANNTPGATDPVKTDLELKQLEEEFKDFSPGLVHAVFRSNSWNVDLTRGRLNGIRKKRTGWSWNASFKRENESIKKPKKSGRLPSIKNDVFKADPSSKITVDKQKTSIFDRYSSVMSQNNRKIPSKIYSEDDDEDDLPVIRKKRKLVRADVLSNKQPTRLDKAKNKILNMRTERLLNQDGDAAENDDDDELSADDDISGEEYEERVVELNIDDQVLTFINTALAADLANLSDAPIEKANVIISMRPFSSLDEFSKKEFLTEKEKAAKAKNPKKKGGRGSSKKNESERYIEKITQSIRGYNAIDSLIKKCSSYGDTLASQMKRWGVNFSDANNGADLDFMCVDSDAAIVEEFDESDVNSASSTPAPTLLPKPTVEKKIKTLGSDEEDFEDFEDSEEDEEYGVTVNRRRNIQLNRRASPQRKALIKFFKGKPRLLAPEISLKDYQQTGINWLNLLYQNQMSCILADDMGLGKTCQVISFFAYLKQINQAGPHLVVVPSSTLENWLREFQKFAPSLKIEPYYGSQQERAELRGILEQNEGQYDVIVTTYNLAAGNKYDVSFLRSRNFNVIVYDEGHMLKNSMTDRFAKLMKIAGNFRLLLTGTPLQNNLRELMSLLEFIMPSIFESKKESLASVFKQRARTSDNNKDYNPLLAEEAITRAKTMMRPFILRRRKDQVLKHLPKKHKKIEFCDMTDLQKDIYHKQISSVIEHKRMIKEDLLPENKKERAKILASGSNNLIMSLRKASNHPLLFRHIYDDKKITKMSDAILDEPEYMENGNREYIKEDMSVMSDFELHLLCCNFPNTLKKFTIKNDEWMNYWESYIINKIIEKIIIGRQEKVLIFSQFTQVLDILEKVLSTLNYKFLRLDGSTQVNDRQSLIDKFYEDKEIPIFILSTKAGGFGINLVCANNVIIFDQSFNPHDDRQAADRAHRVGQTKEVNVSILITKNSIDEKIYELAQNKLALDQHISEDDPKNLEAMNSKVSDMLEDIIYEENK
ncbi:hypothetical protein TBLA_0A04680 [Henningerozyma blattae CBS 6284]|uniref:DNA helicase n=1 Tax=Henningerozyma blattae (strain ATCC 34711 / CBS 6284 / DSM 70876 / NBRC 10599 / NRRL Y-10934 / UCD 77-7) TaxID=1071380 RepID=I2GVW0_HENB6|nr:hypothetical protein TBLA_0A04680 [Tetrapisispora blattae CBS 6284]CCH58262.1 hypothetical protein TBLA_0A04680 [Tetrapisispora blattae CBS 6284]